MSRTITTSRNVFHVGGGVTFDFSNGSNIAIKVPAASTWEMPLHWHYRRLDARQIRCVSGWLRVYSTVYGSLWSKDSYRDPGAYYPFTLDSCTSWSAGMRIDDDFEPVREDLEVILVANEVLHRNLCSFILDGDVFPDLDTTPLWLKALFKILDRHQNTKRRLLDWMSYFQRQVTLHEHDYYEDCGRIRFTALWPWTLDDRVPKGLRRLQVYSMYCISILAMGACYWFGRLGCGIKAVYPEYTPKDDTLGNGRVVVGMVMDGE